MSRAGALAGYLATERHGAVTFAFLVDEWDGDPQALAAVRSRVLAHLIAD
jgi:D-alanyl-D-alanine carboxypeptidase